MFATLSRAGLSHEVLGKGHASHPLGCLKGHTPRRSPGAFDYTEYEKTGWRKETGCAVMSLALDMRLLQRCKFVIPFCADAREMVLAAC